MKQLTRRQLLGASVALGAAPLLALGNTTAIAAEPPRVDPSDPQARALSYVHESPQADRNCANCRLYTGPADTAWGPCAIFPGKQVAAAGWCSAWVAKA